MVLHVYFLEDWERQSMFVALPRALHTLGDGLGLTVAHLSQRLVMVAADGASVLQGKSSGLIMRVQQQAAPYAQPMHCMAHRVDLGAGVLDRHSLMEGAEKLVSSTANFTPAAVCARGA